MKVIIDKRHINPEFWSDDLVEITAIKKCDVGPNHLFYSIYVKTKYKYIDVTHSFNGSVEYAGTELNFNYTSLDLNGNEIEPGDWKDTTDHEFYTINLDIDFSKVNIIPYKFGYRIDLYNIGDGVGGEIEYEEEFYLSPEETKLKKRKEIINKLIS